MQLHKLSLCLVGLLSLTTFACTSTVEDPEGVGSTSEDLSAGAALETWNGVTAHVYGGVCAPVYARSGTDVGYGGGGTLTDTCGFQCVELAARYMHFKEGISGWNVPTAIQMCGSHPASIVATNSPQVGDLMVYKANDPFYGTGSAGHVAIIRGLSADGTLQVFNQRWGNEATAFVNGIRRDHAACFLHSVNNGGGGGGGGGGGCSSASLGRVVPDRSCVQSRFDSAWYVCEGSGWYVANGPNDARCTGQKFPR